MMNRSFKENQFYKIFVLLRFQIHIFNVLKNSENNNLSILA